jgi:hypothetical protein
MSEVGDARNAISTLLAARSREATICPSEVARSLCAPDWRDAMPGVHAAVDQLVAQGAIRLSWKGQALAERAGPYRIGHGDGGEPLANEKGRE